MKCQMNHFFVNILLIFVKKNLKKSHVKFNLSRFTIYISIICRFSNKLTTCPRLFPKYAFGFQTNRLANEIWREYSQCGNFRIFCEFTWNQFWKFQSLKMTVYDWINLQKLISREIECGKVFLIFYKCFPTQYWAKYLVKCRKFRQGL